MPNKRGVWLLSPYPSNGVNGAAAAATGAAATGAAAAGAAVTGCDRATMLWKRRSVKNFGGSVVPGFCHDRPVMLTVTCTR